MNKDLSGLLKKILLLTLCVGTLPSCKKMYDLQPQDSLNGSQVYQNIYDADAAVLGIYGQFIGLADRYIILNELQGDLADITPNASNYLKQLGNHTVTADNPYADPRPFYKVINSCNDALKNFGIMHQSKLLDDNQYYQRYSDIGILRSWLYLQVGIQYGTVPYVTDPIADVNDLNNESKFPKITFDQLLDKLIAFTGTIPTPYLAQNTSVTSPTLLVANSNYILKDGVFKFFIHKKSFLGDLNLWKGNYLQAASYYKDVVETATSLVAGNDFDIQLYDTYRVTNDNSGRNTLMTTGTTNPWPAIFSNPLSETETNRERMWILPLDQNYNANPFLALFSSTSSYLLKPSALAINNWDNQTRSDGGLGDRRGLNGSYRVTKGKPEIAKYLYNYDPLLPLSTKTGIWLLYRAGALHLHYAEAVNQLGRSQLAGVVINDGFYTGFPGSVSSYNGVPEAYPFNFNAVKPSGGINGNWYRSIGIRGRAVNKNVTFDPTNLVTDTENKIIDEDGLELAYEGYRWPDLLRVALRRYATDPSYLANKIGAKFDAVGSADASTVRARLSNKANWFLPFKWQ
ncbi:RagB/SusD family nutrient uptake outer membrane protein [Mucilaginibacter paludis]|uniref:RagB/SusD domain-containing protein n=1 Tax=Mucilaginibacter paludis DSM 18603 TaxID=714943 RepID=H1Y9V5_9SPHI|nr:hypothetical protein [Mucilaginibacter paludis]EHQ31138.1 hypothetical protein Mucpa_7095 [Mucilaginibacter paludis DSM 18603]